MRSAFTPQKRQVFLDQLAGCANVMRSAGAAGVGVTTVYDARRRDPVFAGQWDEAIEAGYATLEALLIERAALGKDSNGGAYRPGATPVPGPETIDTWLALDLLRMARAPRVGPGKRNGAPPRRASEKDTAEAILAKLEVLEKRRTLRRRSGQAGKKAPRPFDAAQESLRSGRADEKGPAKNPLPSGERVG